MLQAIQTFYQQLAQRITLELVLGLSSLLYILIRVVGALGNRIVEGENIEVDFLGKAFLVIKGTKDVNIQEVKDMSQNPNAGNTTSLENTAERGNQGDLNVTK